MWTQHGSASGVSPNQVNVRGQRTSTGNPANAALDGFIVWALSDLVTCFRGFR